MPFALELPLDPAEKRENADAQTGSEDGHGIGSQPAGETDRAGQPHSGARRQPLDAPRARG